MSTAELACTYAALILHDDGADVSVRRRRLPSAPPLPFPAAAAPPPPPPPPRPLLPRLPSRPASG